MIEFDDYGCYSDGVHQYKRLDGAWVIDEEADTATARHEKTRIDLYWALRSRVLTGDEMTQVLGYGLELVIQRNTPYMPNEKHEELNLALAQQFRLRTIAKTVDISKKVC
jgi:hypothetical protein